MIIVTGIIEVETEAELLRVTETLNRRARKSRADEGNIDYMFSVSLENPLQVRLTEIWESESLLDAHLMVPDDEFNAVIAGAKIVSASVNMHEVAHTKELLRR
jgi:quinol monooxygenase YgiN